LFGLIGNKEATAPAAATAEAPEKPWYAGIFGAKEPTKVETVEPTKVKTEEAAPAAGGGRRKKSRKHYHRRHRK